MSDKLQFREKLKGILGVALEKNKVLTREDIQQYFEEDHLTEEQMLLVYDYLLSQKIAIKGYLKQETEEVEEEKAELSENDLHYLKEYEEELSMLHPLSEKEEKLKKYFPKVIEIAKKLYNENFFIGDLIQEGNICLLMALENENFGEKEITEAIYQGIQILIEEQTELKRRDEKMVEKVAFLDESIKSLTEELSRKPTIDELSLYMDMSEEEIQDIIRLTGEEDDDEEEENKSEK